MSESDSSYKENVSMPRKQLKINPSPQSSDKIGFELCQAPRTPKKKLFSGYSSIYNSPLIRSQAILGKKLTPKKASQKAQVADASPKKMKRKSQRKLNLTPALLKSSENKKISSIHSLPSLDLISGYLSSPEKVRECSQFTPMFGKELCVSPLMPLSIPMDFSPVIGLSHLSSLEVCDDNDEEGLESPPGPTALLDTIKDDLIKPFTSQRSEGSSEDYCNQTIAASESSKSEADVWAAPHGSCASLRNFLTRKNMAKGPPLVNELEDSTRETIMCITSKWKDEQRGRVNAIQKFQHITENVLACMSRDVKEITECEKAAATLWEQQVEKLRKHRHAQEKELSKLKNAHDELKDRLQESATIKNSHRDIRATLKKDIETFKRKLEEKYMEHSLEAMKRCLETSFLFS
ncbi:hypothetical protein ElyMa_000246300 [Elysia marginata]|uniref:Transforming acidic coiled-coil-containing protein C-terminal domain-containing protein n=1 Tax=Elysia marginata TaxID=1093978 RepID=A0AAV4F1Q1_9GAST|nr:hypothetical protein ElyMa_000246300 [Elysia marginata]